MILKKEKQKRNKRRKTMKKIKKKLLPVVTVFVMVLGKKIKKKNFSKLDMNFVRRKKFYYSFPKQLPISI